MNLAEVSYRNSTKPWKLSYWDSASPCESLLTGSNENSSTVKDSHEELISRRIDKENFFSEIALLISF